MKNFKYIFASWLALLLFLGCDQGIDGISKVDPGADLSAPVVKINFPLEGTKIKVLEVVTSITIDFEVTDDIEISAVRILLNGTEIGSFTNFLDFRRVVVSDFVYDNLRDGTHELSIIGTDIEGKTTTATVNFEKEPAYTPKYAGEIFYMPFDGDVIELVSISPATRVGTPGFYGDSFVGLNAYKGAADAYLTFPTEGLLGTEFSAAFWYKLDENPDRAGILVVGPPDLANPGNPNNRTAGFRFFRENAGGNQRFKLNVGTGAGESWFDGGAAADVAPGTGWTHMAFSIAADQATVYINGEIVSQGNFPGIDWSGTDILSIMSGAPRFVEWGHLSDQSAMDELRLFNRSLSQGEIQDIIADESGLAIGFVPTFEGEMFYMPFDGDNKELFKNTEATMVGTTTFAGEGVKGNNAFAGASGAYLTVPSSGLTTEEFSATFWYKVNGDPDRAGILVMGPQDTDNAGFPDVQNLRTSGFRLFREGSPANQIIKLNVGTGAGESWFDGGASATLDTTAGEWVHIAFTISGSHAAVYFDGEVVSEGDFSGMDWSGVDMLTIGSGAPRFTEWGHLSDPSFIDELRLYNKALTQSEIQNIRNFDL
ncbi:LamG-like jellyroll fold domain-containing protein [Arenibacter sp. GZD96]|uniref:LamG-like jellyroll fold domain-containing protein n=1 Tax=Aurantibrevibacter litoralis TaxID=3106030 RepID=UPI002AFFDE87|nr:LamG-like jellyroll fold domain-containing protein [Arenibacter sp. GZD-96]MEA1785239.1 LamG-like jellyroll fold domain-containing protein [Arenibacter sp. GZD-96]